MHKNAMKCNETLSKWCKNKHGASKIIDTFETYHATPPKMNSMTSVAPLSLCTPKQNILTSKWRILSKDGEPSGFTSRMSSLLLL
jgi:hypothetical protein